MKVIFKIKNIILLLTMLAGVGMVQSCTENIDTSARYTFTGSTVFSYLEDYPETYSEYIELLKEVKISDFSESTVSQLLTARGNYTCFAPTNEAIDKYLHGLVAEKKISTPSWDAPEFQAVNPDTQEKDLLNEVKRTIVYNSIIDCGDDTEAYITSDFSERAGQNQMLGIANMMNRKLQVSVGKNTKYAINGCDVSNTNCDIYTINGRIHQVDSVIAPSTETAQQYFQKIVENRRTMTVGEKTLYVTACLVEACGLGEELSKTEDENYYNKKMSGMLKDLDKHPTFYSNPGYLPERRYYGFTIFTEGDRWWENALGLEEGTINTVEPDELVAKVANYIKENNLVLSTAVHDENYKSEENALNQFVTYHILPAKIERDKLVIHFNELYYSLDNQRKMASVFDYYTTMGKRRLMKTYEASNVNKDVIFINRFPILNNGRHDNYTERDCEPDKVGVAVLAENKEDENNVDAEKDDKIPSLYNAYVYRVSNCLYFNDEVAKNMGSERIRIDAATMFKELMTNDIRCNENFTAKYQCVGMPKSKDYQYLEDCDISENTNFYYLTGRLSKTSCWKNYQGDELNVVGNYEITIKLPPVPLDEMYELRLGVSTNDRRGMCQVYWGPNKNALPAAGIPFDMRMGGKSLEVKGGGNLPSIVGWEEDQEDDDEVNAEVDKKMRNNGYMKGPNSYYEYGAANGTTLRASDKVLRRIILREDMKANETYYIQFKSVLEDTETEFYLDYIEFCPKSVYDNPLIPEDIW